MHDHNIAKFISETQRGLHRQRQPLELRVVFTSLTFYVLATAAVLSEEVVQQALEPWYMDLCVWVFFIGVAGIASYYLYRLHTSNRININMAQNAERILTRHVEESSGETIYLNEHDRKKNRESPIVCEVNWICQTSLILIFAIGTAFIITRNRPASNSVYESAKETIQTLEQSR